MAKLLARPGLRVYMPSLRCLQAAVFQRSNISTCRGESKQSSMSDAEVMPDPSLGPLAPRDPFFPLPGNVGIASNLYGSQPAPPVPDKLPDVLTRALPAERHSIILAQFLNTAADLDDEADDAEMEQVSKVLENHPTVLECVAQQCPDTLRKSFLDLFPGVAAKSLEKMTVVTLCQRTKNNMTSWNAEVEQERDDLLGIFMSSAEEICKLLQEAGYWADFIDPSSGQAESTKWTPGFAGFQLTQCRNSEGFFDNVLQHDHVRPPLEKPTVN